MSKHAAPSLTNDAKEAERDALKAGPHVMVNQPRHAAHIPGPWILRDYKIGKAA